MEESLEDKRALASLINRMRGHDTSDYDVSNRGHLAITKSFILSPKSSASGINDYLQKNRITRSMISTFEHTVLANGSVFAILIWGKKHGVAVSGPDGQIGLGGDQGATGPTGKDGQCTPCTDPAQPYPLNTSSSS